MEYTHFQDHVPMPIADILQKRQTFCRLCKRGFDNSLLFDCEQFRYKHDELNSQFFSFMERARASQKCAAFSAQGCEVNALRQPHTNH